MKIRKANVADIPAIMELLQLRIQWMDQMGLYQWNKTAYLTVYPYEYFVFRVKQDDLFVAHQDEQLIGVMALLKHDERWPSSAKALYVHHLATLPSCHGLGLKMLQFAEHEVLAMGGDRLRLDCQTVNQRLNQYYLNQGYRCVGQCIDGEYEGNLMEKQLSKGTLA